MKNKILIVLCAVIFIFTVSCDVESISEVGNTIKDKAQDIAEDIFDLEEPDKFELDGSVHSILNVSDFVVNAKCPYEGAIPMGTVKSSSATAGEQEQAITFVYAESGKILYITSSRNEDKFYKGSHAGMTINELTELYGEATKEDESISWYFKKDGQKSDDSYTSDFSITAKTDNTGKVTEISLMNTMGISDMIN